MDRTEQVDLFMNKLDHPYKAEIQAVRDSIKSANAGITEQIKWRAPSFSYHGHYLATFNLKATDRIHLVFHNPRVVTITSPLLEGTYRDRRMTYFASMADVQAKTTELTTIIQQLTTLIDD